MNNNFNELIIVSVLIFLSVLALLLGIYIINKKKKQNRLIWIPVLIITLFFWFAMFPFVVSIKKKDGLIFFMAIIMECYAICIAIPWCVLLFVSLLFFKKLKYMSLKQKIVIAIFLLILFAVCIGITLTIIPKSVL